MDSFFDRALATALKLGASDIHLKPESRPILRIAGELRTLLDVPPLGRDFLHGLAMSLLNDRRRELLERVGDVTVALTTGGGIRLRVHIAQQRAGTGVTLRIVPSEPRRLEALGMGEATLAGVRRLLGAESGLVLVAGRPGAGKTTTLAAMLDEVATRRPVHLMTIEDPVEILLKDRQSLVEQREVGIDVPNVAAGLRSMARHDVDVVMVGEINDKDGAELLVAAAETGRLALAGIVAASSAGALGRLVGLLDPERRPETRERVDRVLVAVIHQRLIAPPPAPNRKRTRMVEADLVLGRAAPPPIATVREEGAEDGAEATADETAPVEDQSRDD